MMIHERNWHNSTLVIMKKINCNIGEGGKEGFCVFGLFSGNVTNTECPFVLVYMTSFGRERGRDRRVAVRTGMFIAWWGGVHRCLVRE